jgi:hypothetical protein
VAVLVAGKFYCECIPLSRFFEETILLQIGIAAVIIHYRNGC